MTKLSICKNIITFFKLQKLESNQTPTSDAKNGSTDGPLINMKGEVIDITTLSLGEANINFAVNISHIPSCKFL